MFKCSAFLPPPLCASDILSLDDRNALRNDMTLLETLALSHSSAYHDFDGSQLTALSCCIVIRDFNDQQLAAVGRGGTGGGGTLVGEVGFCQAFRVRILPLTQRETTKSRALKKLTVGSKMRIV